MQAGYTYLSFTSSDGAGMLAEQCHKLGELWSKILPIQRHVGDGRCEK
jgi:hypothetical protein